MKKIARLMTLALAVFTMASCEDVPSPYGTVTPPPTPSEVIPTGDGTATNPFNVTAAVAKCKEVGTEPSTEKYYVTGVVVTAGAASADFGNAEFTISDEGSTAKFKCYQVAGPDGKKLPSGYSFDVGDVVVVYGQIYNFKGTTPETAGKGTAWVVLHNGNIPGGETPSGEAKGIGTLEDPFNAVAANLEASKLASGTTSDKQYYIKGKVAKIPSNANYGEGKYPTTANYYISDDGEDANTFYIYASKYLGNKDYSKGAVLKVGDEVIVFGNITNYNGTYETAQNKNYLYSLNGENGSGGDTPSSDLGTKDNPLTVVKALDVINALSDGGETETEAYVKGKISKVQSYSDKYKSITYYISDDGTETKELQIYSGKNIGGAEFASQDDLSAGDEVVVKGKLKKFMKSGEVVPEMNQPNEIISITKAGGGTPSGNTGLEASFASDEAGFTIDNKEIGSLSFVWKYDSKGYMKASAFVNNANTAAESWLVSPVFSLKGVTAPVMTFNNAVNYVKEGNITDHIKVMVYDGSNWTEATIANMPDGKSWTFVDSTVDLKSVAGKEGVKIAFKYVSTTAVAPTWEIKTVSVK